MMHIPLTVRNQRKKPVTVRHWTKKPFEIKDSLSQSSRTVSSESAGDNSVFCTTVVPAPGLAQSINCMNGRMKIDFHIQYHVEILCEKLFVY